MESADKSLSQKQEIIKDIFETLIGHRFKVISDSNH